MSTTTSQAVEVEIDREYSHIHVADYYKFRAEKEGVDEQELGLQWFEDLLKVGVRTFYGINTDESGNVLTDIQNPQALREYMRTI